MDKESFYFVLEAWLDLPVKMVNNVWGIFNITNLNIIYKLIQVYSLLVIYKSRDYSINAKYLCMYKIYKIVGLAWIQFSDNEGKLPGSNEKQLSEDIQSIVVSARNFLFFGSFSVTPTFPIFFVLCYFLQKLIERFLQNRT